MPPMLLELIEQPVDGDSRTTLVTHLGRSVSNTASLTAEEWRGFSTKAVVAREARSASLDSFRTSLRSPNTDVDTEKTGWSERDEEHRGPLREPSTSSSTLFASIGIALGEMEGIVALMDALIRGLQQMSPESLSGSAEIQAPPAPTATSSLSRGPDQEPALVPTPRVAPARGTGTERDFPKASTQHHTAEAASIDWGSLWMRRLRVLQSIRDSFGRQQEKLLRRQAERRRFRRDLTTLCYGETNPFRLRTKLLDTAHSSEAWATQSPRMEQIGIEVHLYDDCWLPLYHCDWSEISNQGHVALKRSDIAARMGSARQVLLQFFTPTRIFSWRTHRRPLLSSNLSEIVGWSTFSIKEVADLVGVASVRRALLWMSYQRASLQLYERLIQKAQHWHRSWISSTNSINSFDTRTHDELRDIDERGFTINDAILERPIIRVALELVPDEAVAPAPDSEDMNPVLFAFDDLVLQSRGDLDVILRVFAFVLRIHHTISTVKAMGQYLGLDVEAGWLDEANVACSTLTTWKLTPYELHTSLVIAETESIRVCSLLILPDAIYGRRSTRASNHLRPITISSLSAFLVSNLVAILQERVAAVYGRALRDLSMTHEIQLLSDGIIRMKIWTPKTEASETPPQPKVETLTIVAPSRLNPLDWTNDRAVFRFFRNEEELFVGDLRLLYDFIGQPLDIQHRVGND
ncbi:hypothetical protein CCYA_CCYA03G0992 [Cyanidiococcus yangmingshanensis]|nr:hypothetical protein CCYA_CCYA03G0992 [Cyanidiococcus yangmingshanensis]